jgi:hypothetical protein
MQWPRTIAKELLGQNRMVTVAVFFSEAFLQDAAIQYCLLHHPFSKKILIPQVKICF